MKTINALARGRRNNLRTGRLSLSWAAGSLVPLLATVLFPSTELILVFTGMALVGALGGFASRRTTAGRLALLLILLVALPVGYGVGLWHEYQAGTFGGAQVMPREFFEKREMPAGTATFVNGEWPAYIDGKSAALRDAPSEQARMLRTLPSGTEFTIIGDQGGFFLVRLENGVQGWTAKSSVNGYGP